MGLWIAHWSEEASHAILKGVEYNKGKGKTHSHFSPTLWSCLLKIDVWKLHAALTLVIIYCGRFVWQTCHGTVVCADQRQQHPWDDEGTAPLPGHLWPRVQGWLLLQHRHCCCQVGSSGTVKPFKLYIEIVSCSNNLILFLRWSSSIEITHFDSGLGRCWRQETGAWWRDKKVFTKWSVRMMNPNSCVVVRLIEQKVSKMGAWARWRDKITVYVLNQNFCVTVKLTGQSCGWHFSVTQASRTEITWWAYKRWVLLCKVEFDSGT